MINFHKQFLPFTIIILAFVFSAGLIFVAHAQSGIETISAGINFPVAELGNCSDRASCRAYCDNTENMDACISFSKSRGLMTEEQAGRANKFALELRINAGPGGCKTPGECRLYCEDVANLNICIEFAKKHKINDSHTSEAERMSVYIKSGGTMPGGCTGKESCQAYCSDFNNDLECRTFAQKAGLTASQGRNIVPPGQLQKFFELTKAGKTPGGCTSTNSCKVYCEDVSHREECIAWKSVV